MGDGRIDAWLDDVTGRIFFGLSLISRHLIILDAIKVLGTAYLGYLGITSWRKPRPGFEGDIQASVSSWALFHTGIWVSLSNPKAILFFVAFFPKFINFSAPLTPQYVVLIAGFFVIETVWQLIYAINGQKLATWLGQGRRLLWLNRIYRLIFLAIAAALVWEVMS